MNDLKISISEIERRLDYLKKFQDLDINEKLIAEITQKNNYFSRILRRLKNIYYYILKFFSKPIINRQRLYNNENINLNKATMDFIEEMHKRLINLENKNQDIYPLDLDYAEFEDGFRGPEEIIKKNQKEYLKYFNNGKSVLDIGCGRGEFLELLQENNINGNGIDISKNMVSRCLNKGLDVRNIDAENYLKDSKPESIGNIFISMVIEHMTFNEVYRLLKYSWDKMEKDSVLVMETINPKSFYAQVNCYDPDPTHSKLVFPETLRFLCEKIGFSNPEIKYKAKVPDDKILKKLDKKIIEGITNVEILNNNIDILNKLIFGYLEYYIVCKK